MSDFDTLFYKKDKKNTLKSMAHYLNIRVKKLTLMTKKSFTFFFSLLLTLLLTSAYADDKTEKSYDVGMFDKIYLQGPYEVHLRQGSECKLTIRANDSYFEYLDIDSSDDELSIVLDEKKFRKTRAVEVYVTFRNLKKLSIEGAVDLMCENQIKTDNLKLEFEGAGKVDLDVQAEKIISEIAGVGHFIITGKTTYHKVEFSGIGSYDAQELHSQYTIVESNGIGSVKVFASNKFRGEANGIGSVDYFGDPDDVSVDASGLGSINRH